jgi:hypothetical protein
MSDRRRSAVIANDPPAGLRRAGIRRATSNAEGRELDLHSLLFRTFRRGLEQAFLRPADDEEEAPCTPASSISE